MANVFLGYPKLNINIAKMKARISKKLYRPFCQTILYKLSKFHVSVERCKDRRSALKTLQQGFPFIVFRTDRFLLILSVLTFCNLFRHRSKIFLQWVSFYVFYLYFLCSATYWRAANEKSISWQTIPNCFLLFFPNAFRNVSEFPVTRKDVIVFSVWV